MTYSYEVVIIGAGIAGLYTAQLLGKYNIRVGLIDTKADFTQVTFYTLGSFLDPDRFDLSSQIIAAKETEIFFHSKHIHICKKGKAYILNKKNSIQSFSKKP